MRVHHVITRLIVGGAQENTLSTVLGLLVRPNMEVRLLSGPTHGSEGSLEGLLDPYPGCLIRIPSLVRPVRPIRELRAIGQLTSLFRRERPDIVHTHSGKAGILGRVAARRARVSIVIHGIHGPSFGHFQGPLPNLLFKNAERWAGKMTDHFVVVADAMRQQYLAAGIGRPEQYTRVYSGFDLRPFLEARRDEGKANSLGLKPEHFVVGTIARLFALKGHDDLIDAAPELVRRIPNIRFLWIGDGPWRQRLLNRIRASGLQDHFILAGLVPPSEVPSWIGLMDCLAHLSRREGLPRALPQAMAAGKPVVAFDCDGAGEACRSGETGFLIAPGDQKGLIDALTTLARDTAMGRHLGENGREWVRDRFTAERLVSDQYDLYRRLTAQRLGQNDG